MRTPLVLFFGSLLVGCTVGDPGTGGDDGDDTGGGAVCGNGVKESSEACDDGNAAGGDGCSATCTVEAVPALAISVDKPTISTELRTTNMVTVTLTSSGGFSGPVTLTGAAVNAQSAPISGWTVAFNNPTVTVPADGSVDVVATLTIPSENRGLQGTLKIDAASSLAPKSVSSQVTAVNQVSLPVTMTGGLCVYTGVTGQTKVTVGTKVRMVNKGTDNMIFHSDGAGVGVPHQNTGGTGTAVNGSYDTTINLAGGAFGWYCHSPGPNPNGAVQILPVAVVP
ncbi:MAG TPA: myxococcus cysteine-rich repeat containing protein [Kofleriaceae bacterium]|nr:myxococcus cysteine-rich repeat containing protein [Kofleriaceae bacterium]